MRFFADNDITFTGVIRLADFGSAFEAAKGGNDLTRWEVKAPERLEERQWNIAADVWALGCTIVELATGRQLFTGPVDIPRLNWTNETFLDVVNKEMFKHRSNMMKQKLHAKLKDYDASNVFGANMDVVQLLAGMLTRDPEERHTMRLVASEISFARNLEKVHSELKASKSGPIA